MERRLNSVPDFSTDTLVYDFAIAAPAIAKTGRIQAYQLRQVSFRVQKLVLLSGDRKSLNFVIKLQDFGSSKGKKPQTTITKHLEGVHAPFADIHLEPGSHGTTIQYTETGYAQILSAKTADNSSQTCAIGEEPHAWRPLGPSRLVLELVNSAVERVAIFVHTESFFLPPKHKLGWEKEQELGELHILRHVDVAPRVVDEIIGSAVAVIGQGRRRASV